MDEIKKVEGRLKAKIANVLFKSEDFTRDDRLKILKILAQTKRDYPNDFDLLLKKVLLNPVLNEKLDLLNKKFPFKKNTPA